VKDLQVEKKIIVENFYLFIYMLIVLTYRGYSIGLWRIILYVVTPIMVLKQIISLIHLYTAALDMAAIDEAERTNKTRTN